MRRIMALFIALTVAFLAGCQKEEPEMIVIPSPILTITMSDGLVMTAELYPMTAPNTVANIVNLAQQGFYDGLSFYRVVAGFVIQTGDPTGTGRGGANYKIKGEFEKNGFPNDISHTRGVLSMARYPSDYDSASSSFFIVHSSANYLDGEYAAFGKLIGDASFEALDAIANTPTDINEKPLVDRIIDSVTVDTLGYTYSHEEIE